MIAKFKFRCSLLLLTYGVCLMSTAEATFHFMQIEQVIGGVNGDTAAQAIQLRMRGAFQNSLAGSRIRAWDAAGLNPILLIDITSSVASANLGDRILIASADFASLTTPLALPDFLMTNLIPPSYLPAGSITYEDNFGSVYWRISWGGSGYTGDTTGTITNDPDGEFGPPFAGPLPSSDDRALLFNGSASATSSTNDNDYTITLAAATFTNNGGASFLISVPTPLGACCDTTTENCLDDILEENCMAVGLRFGGGGSTCTTIDPPCVLPPSGACCFELTGVCEEDVSQFACEGAGGRYGGDDVTCLNIAPPCDQPPLAISLELVAEGLTAPLMLTHAGDGSGRLFVIDQVGQIRIIDASGTLLPTPFLDLSSQLVTVGIEFFPGFVFDERGLLGLAFHPDYVTNGRFFVRYSAPRTSTGIEPCDLAGLLDVLGQPVGCHEEILSEFSVLGDPATSNVADPASEIILFRVDEPQFNHNSGHVAFGPDGFLYWTLGDGGGANDGLDGGDPPGSAPLHGPIGNGQNIETALGSVLRIDVDSTPDIGLPYAIPPDNPFVGVTGVDEIYAYGLRNPYRFSFDDGPGGDGSLYVADVGQALFEEINKVTLGGNYGWVIREGFQCFDPLAPSIPPANCPTTGAAGEPLLDPILEYNHGVGIAVIGGYVYRGSAFPPLVGRYVFGDFSQDFGPTGQLFYADLTGPDAFVRRTFNIAPDLLPLGQALFGLGQGEDGELYVLASDNIGPVGNAGVVKKIVPPILQVTQISPRYIAITPPPSPEPFSIIFEATCDGAPTWGATSPVGEFNSIRPTAPANAASLSFLAWGERVLLNGIEIGPGTEYKLYTAWGDPGDRRLSPPILAKTSIWGDVVGGFVDSSWAAPDGSADIVTDVVAIIDGFRNLPTAPEKYRIDLVGVGAFGPTCLTDIRIDLIDAVAALDGFRSIPIEDSVSGCLPDCPQMP